MNIPAVKLYAYTLPTVAEKSGWLKIGQTTGSIEERIKAQLSQANLEYKIVWWDSAIVNKHEITDNEIHRYLVQKDFEKSKEWFHCSIDDVKEALESLKEFYRKADKRKELSDKFYEELRNWYYWATEESKDGEYSLRIIIRLLLCFFLREKELIPCELFDKDWVEINLKEDAEYRYYKAILRNLFFYSLNTPINQRGELENRKLILHYNKVKEVLHKKIPFLNGGLFMEHPGDDFTLNDVYFFADTWTIPLKELGGKYPVKGIVKILLQYQYTLDETDGTEYIDPEFIGKMFESLLACIDADSKESRQKITGSYYTPREIVSYMVNEALDAYLKTSHNVNDNAENLLLRCSILDPSCGSGAFPCGVMNEIMRRIDPNKTMTQTERYRKKLEILRNVIYGVDIQPIAVQIAIFRLFLSLIQEVQPTKDPKENFGIESLPNLEYKFVSADTLKGIEADGLLFYAYRPLFHQILKLKEDYFRENIVSAKERLKARIELAEKELADNSDDEQIKMLCQWNHSDTQAAPYFDSRWMFGVEKFDIVIGNPPYNQVHKGIFDKTRYPYSEGKDPGKQNLYKVFIEAGYNMAKQDDGLVCLIVQSSLMCDLSATYTRELLLSKTQLYQIVEFPKKAPTQHGQVFKSVLQGTCICFFRKTEKPNNVLRISCNNDTSTIPKLSFEKVKQRVLLDEQINFAIPLVKKREFAIYRKIKKKTIPLKDIIESITKGDLNLGTQANTFSTTKTPVKLYRGENIHRYQLDNDTDNYLVPSYFPKKIQYNKKNILLVCQEVTGTVDPRRLNFTLIEKPNAKFVFGDTVQKIVLKNQKRSKTILAILNSSLMDWYFRKTSTNNHIGGYEIVEFPIPKTIDTKTAKRLSDLAERRLQGDIKVESKIDTLVYQLYGLTDEEIKIAEGTSEPR